MEESNSLQILLWKTVDDPLKAYWEEHGIITKDQLDQLKSGETIKLDEYMMRIGPNPGLYVPSGVVYWILIQSMTMNNAMNAIILETQDPKKEYVRFEDTEY